VVHSDLRSLAASLVGTFVLRVASAVMGSMIQLYLGYIDRSVYPLSVTMRGIALAVFFLPELIGSPVLGAWSDRYGRKFFIWFSALSGGIAVQIAALTTHFGALVLTRLLAGLSTASAFPATLGLLSAETSHDEALRGRVMGLFQLATIGGTALGILLGGGLWDLFHAHAFTLNHVIYLVSFAIFFFGIRKSARKDAKERESARKDAKERERARKDAKERESARKDERRKGAKGKERERARKDAKERESARKDAKERERSALGEGTQAWRRALNYYRDALLAPAVLRFVPAWLTINIILGIWLNQIVGQLVAPRGRFPHQLLFGLLGDSGHAGTMLSLAALALAVLFVVGILAWSWVLGRIRRTTVMLLGTGGLLALCAILFAINHRPSFDDPLIPFFITSALAALFILSGMMPAALTYLADVTEVRADDRGAIMGMYTIIFGAGQFFGTLLGGPFADWAAIDGILFITAVLGIFALATLLRLHRAETGALVTEGILVQDEYRDK
jgi:MFS family permease